MPGPPPLEVVEEEVEPRPPKPAARAVESPGRSAAGEGAAKTLDNPGGIRSGKLAGRSLSSAIVVVALPVLLEQFAAACVGLVDKTVAGHLPAAIVKPALDGVGLASYVTWFINVAVSAIGIGGMALIARSIGAGEREQAERTLAQSLLFGTAWGALVGAALWLVCPLMARVANLSDQAATYCVQYVRLLALAMPLTSVLFVSINCLHGAGETVRPFAVMVVVNVVNALVSWALSGADLAWSDRTLANPFDFDRGVYGIALGTVIGHAVGALLMYGLMLRGVRDLRLRHRHLQPDWSLFHRIVRIGVPGFLDGFGLWIGQLFAVLWVLGAIVDEMGLPEGLIGAHEIAIQWEAFSFLPGYAMGVAAGALAGQFLGAGNPAMARRAVGLCLAFAITLMTVMGAAFIAFGEPLTALISDDPVHLKYAAQALFIVGFVQPFFALSLVIRGGLSGAGDTRASMILIWISTYAVRLPLTWLLGDWLGLGFVGVWIGLTIELFVRGLLFLGRYLHGGWMRVKV